MKYALYILFFILGFFTCSLSTCENEPITVVDNTAVVKLHTENNLLRKSNAAAEKELIISQKAKDSLKKAAAFYKNESDRLKRIKKTAPKYNPQIDTTYSKIEIKAELAKADNLNKINDSIIKNQEKELQVKDETIAKDSADIQRLNEMNSNEKQISANLSAENDYTAAENKALRKALRKEKTKLILFKVGTIVVTGLLIAALL